MNLRDRLADECGVIGIYGNTEAANLAYLGLYALQHRGQESAGIVTRDGETTHAHRAMGLVNDVFEEKVLAGLRGNIAIGHVRYSTTGSSLLVNAQPLSVNYSRGHLALAHNGNLVNAGEMRGYLERSGSIFRTTTDTEVLAHLIANSRAEGFLDRLVDALSSVRGAYSLTILTEDMLVGARDPLGFRPLVLGRRDDGSYVLASETCALDLIEAGFEREIEPGEIVLINKYGIHSYFPFPKQTPKQCIFEFIYFARPDSYIFGNSVYEVRHALGRKLAEEQPVDADVVFSVPDSGNTAAQGYAAGSGLPYSAGLIRNHYVGRTFIEPSQSIRHFGVKIKLNAIRAVIQDKRCIVVDDSIVRGTTMRKIVSMIRSTGAREVHVRISSPPTIGPCYYGVDTPTQKELIANRMSVEGISDFIDADSVGYLSVDGMLSCVGEQRGRFCDACFSDNYPTEINPDFGGEQKELFC